MEPLVVGGCDSEEFFGAAQCVSRHGGGVHESSDPGSRDVTKAGQAGKPRWNRAAVEGFPSLAPPLDRHWIMVGEGQYPAAGTTMSIGSTAEWMSKRVVADGSMEVNKRSMEEAMGLSRGAARIA